MSEIFSFYAGRTMAQGFEVTDESDNPFDLTGFTVTLTVKKKKGGAAVLTITCTLSATPTDGTFVANATAAQTVITPGDYVFGVTAVSGATKHELYDEPCKILQPVNEAL